jgi:HK97 family phage major capsid protein
MPTGSIENWDLIKEQVEDQIVRVMQPAIIYDKASEKRTVSKGNLVEVVTQSTQLSVQTVTEGTELESDDLSFSRDEIVMTEKGVAPRLQQRFIDDCDWDILGIMAEEIALAFARQKNDDFISTVEAGVSSDTTFAITTAWNDSGANPVDDIAHLIRLLEENNFGQGSKVLLMHPRAYQELRSEADLYYVNRYGDDSVMRTGFIDEILGVPILTSTDCTEAKILLIDTNIGAVRYYEREPVQLVEDQIPRRRAFDIIAYARYAFHVIRPKAIAMATNAIS